MNATPAIPLSLYIHFPYCIRKCPYCDFNTHETGSIPEDAYGDALLRDIAAQSEKTGRRSLTSIFIGGGTPSLISPETIARVLAAVADRFDLTDSCEITLEANPGAADTARFAGFRSAGVNRLSVGVQSFDDHALAALGRVHDGRAALTAIDSAFAAGFDNLNVDLMHGLPEQTPAGAERDVQTAIDLGVPHISWYELTIEPNTVFHSSPPTLPQDHDLADIADAGSTALARGGYGQYEVSAFTQERPSAHNLNYWTFGDYLGIGAGAHGKLTDPEAMTIYRSNKTRMPGDYINRDFQLDTATAVPGDEVLLEFLMNVLRLKDGVPMGLFHARTGRTQAELDGFVDRAIARGLMGAGERLRANAAGYRFLNELLLS